MGTVRDTLTAAFRLGGLVAVGDTPPADEMNIGLEIFQNMIQPLPKVALNDVIIGANYTAQEYDRIFNPASAYTVTLPLAIVDTKTGLTRRPLNGAVVEVVGTTSARSIFISEMGAWNRVDGLALTSTQPFGPEHEQGLRAMTAVRLATGLQKPDVPQWVVAIAEEGRRTIRQRFRQTVTVQTDPLLLNRFQRYGDTLS